MSHAGRDSRIYGLPDFNRNVIRVEQIKLDQAVQVAGRVLDVVDVNKGHGLKRRLLETANLIVRGGYSVMRH